MQLLRKDESKAYYNNMLWLPKSYVSEAQLTGSLIYDNGKGKEPHIAFQIERDHYLVPRNYIKAEALHALPFPVVDVRIKKYPHVHFRSSIVLNKLNPDKDFQTKGCAALLGTNNGVLSIRCGGGKTITCIHAMSQTRVPCLVLVNDKGLAAQWQEEIEKYTDLKGTDIGFVGDGEFRWKHKITIAVVHTIAGRVVKGTLPPELVRWFGVVVADEAHTTAGPAYFGQALTPFHGRRWGLSATPRRNDGFDSLLRYTLGDVVYQYLEPEMKPLIYFRRLQTKLDMKNPLVREAVTDCMGELHLAKLYGYLATREDRLNIITQEIKSALNQKRELLVLSQSRATLEQLERIFPEAGVIHGDVNNRKERLRRIRECNPVIATASLGRQALNKPSLDTLLVLEPFSDASVLQQLIGRIQRTYTGKQQPLAVFYDDVNIEPMHNITLKMRKLFSRWPNNQGGTMRWQNTD